MIFEIPNFQGSTIADMQTIINKPLIYSKLNSNYNYRGPTYLRCSSIFAPNYLSSCSPQIRVSKFGDFVNSWNRRAHITTQIRAKNPNSPENPISWFRDIWRKWRWKPLIEGYWECSLLVVQLRLIMLVIWFLGLGIPIAGFEPPLLTIKVQYSEFLSKMSNNQVDKVVVDGADMLFKLRSNKETKLSSIQGSKPETMSFLSSFLPTKRVVYSTTRPADIQQAPYEKMVDNGISFGSPEKRSGVFLRSAMTALFYIIVVYGAIGALIIPSLPEGFDKDFFFRCLFDEPKTSKSRGSDSENYSGSRTSVTFADVAGIDEVKEELEEIVEFLKNPDRYIRLGARPPRGILLVGRPGTGKTLLAKAVAGEAGVPFFSRSGSEFVEVYVGKGAARVRELFAEAKKVAPSIVFIDEIDAVAQQRDGRFRSNRESDQTLNQLLTEMDGFDSSSKVIVLGATNRVDVLDPAILRPGRFDRVVQVETPNNLGRLAVLKVHVSKKNIPLSEDVDLREIATMTTGFTGAGLANLVNEAALLAGRQHKVSVERIDFVRAFERSIAGIEKKTELKGNDKAVVARHEAGHAVVGTAVASLLSGQPRVKKLSILPRSGGTLGFTYTPPTNDESCLTFVDELRGRLVTLLGGRAAEEFVYAGRVSTGALDDIRRATDMAYKAIAEYGLSQTIGPMSVATLSARDQGYVVDLVQREVKALLQSALDVALCVVRANATVLEGLGALLEENEKVEGEELKAWLKLVVAPTELSLFIQGKDEPLLPPQPDPEKQLQLT